jgi:hypothetical protein
MAQAVIMGDLVPKRALDLVEDLSVAMGNSQYRVLEKRYLTRK